MYPKNTWYVACTPDEIAAKPLGRQICGEKIVFYRAQENKVAAVEDFCPHRGAPLSLGYVEDGNLVCGYHGLVMGCDGKTVSMPGQRVRGFPCNKTFAAVERYGFIWVWPGDQAQADPALIPHLEWAVNDEWAYGGGLFHIGCDYRLMIDNLMDLTHETYVHASSIGQKEIDEAPPVTTVTGDEVVTSRHMENIMAPPFWRMALRGNGLADDVPVDRWQICRFTPPSHVLIEVGVAHAGKGGYHAEAQHKASSIVVDFITPETDTSIWYFWGMARNFAAHDQTLTDNIREGQGKIFSEDLEMLERQQQNLLAYPERNLLKLNIDAGGVQSRKVLERIIAKERAPQPQLIATSATPA
ncbi:TPA: aromatic ring-hydroxylating dioxygenase subunit alpha [Pseudomonas putida]|jgi:vanillate O-demethylase monooxygenase subunit|uniref:aromatic ring-hydroxylating oxygenase subunit alpha n=1 Tax=Pseudomonas TaxID=286 RepID=UPI00235B70D9|nr:aromatic ring-hydroxylating dioxygenase subunit alpha [Pseudomonas putida]ELF6206745.1 aromatic ring-hydroxylating dioxygenase subunit alpha [Pseudomonas putida]GLO09423.1 (2Fe-2S)-binding protein [Pseudomonas putida]GLO25863.1 (2Fe-2S)-binding protein [Pseudomonas putida]HDS0969839.1 aromatic ring-hydroxylating dioxygenase subunit alpha [Pseudomonas putida]HDS0986679.1 aromatic ring-hydroxylating dioxygenase subunit alpha [Pseudomonas putida]